MESSYSIIKISPSRYNLVTKYVKNSFGINLTEAKKQLVVNRLLKRVKSTGFQSIDQYIDFIFSNQGANEKKLLCDLLSTIVRSNFL